MSYKGKVILCGDPSVGKTSLLARYVEDNFNDDYHQTIGANFLIKEIDVTGVIDKFRDSLTLKQELIDDIKEKSLKLYLWDIGGQKHTLFSNEYYFVQAVGAMVIFSLNQPSSFESVDFWISKLIELSGDIPYILIGNKTDLKREISEESVKKKVNELGVKYFETSAKLNQNVDHVFDQLSIKILNNMK